MAKAGDDIDTKLGNFIGLNGSGSSDPDGDQLTYTWTQTWGPDVTGGVGKFVGPTPSFAVPMQVSTLVFELVVNDGSNSLPDTVRINVFEHTGDPGLFVDGNLGSDETGTGTRQNPFASIGFAINNIDGPNQDIYVMSLEGGAAYEEEFTLSPPVTTSLYGGFGPDWIRDVEGNKTRINGAATAIQFHVVDEPAWISGFEVTGANAGLPGQNTFALSVPAGGSTIYVEDNILRAGNAGSANSSTSAGSSYGLWIGDLFNAEVRRNTVIAGNGGSGVNGQPGANGISATTNGNAGKSGENGGNAGGGGKGGIAAINGGAGGKGGSGLIPQDGASGTKGGGSNGGNGGNGEPVGEGGVGDGRGGGGGAGGNGGTGGSGEGLMDKGLFAPANGANGGNGGNGGGGGGGGGGAGIGLGVDGGGGGGGGGGGTGGKGGTGGLGGGASVGMLITDAVTSLIENNEIVAANGGNGGNGGTGGTGGTGTAGGVGGTFEEGAFSSKSGDAGEGGGGGAGGRGGQGGGGAGGPSYGILIAAGTAPVIRNNTITTGNGGSGGAGGGAGLAGAAGGNGASSGGAGGNSWVATGAGTAGTGGDGGYSYAIYDMDVADDEDATLSGNVTSVGSGGAGRVLDGKSGKSGESNYSGS